MSWFSPQAGAPFLCFYNAASSLPCLDSRPYHIYNIVIHLTIIMNKNNLTSQKDLYIEMLKDIYSAEVHTVSAWHFFENSTSNPTLKQLLHDHVGETRMQVLRLEELIENYDSRMSSDHCRTMQTMIEEAKDLVNRCSDSATRDLAILGSVKRINQCELQVYQMLMEMAGPTASTGELELLKYNLREEKELQDSLNKLAKPVAG